MQKMRSMKVEEEERKSRNQKKKNEAAARVVQEERRKLKIWSTKPNLVRFGQSTLGAKRKTMGVGRN
jgi:hypothetical protein